MIRFTSEYHRHNLFKCTDQILENKLARIDKLQSSLDDETSTDYLMLNVLRRVVQLVQTSKRVQRNIRES